TSSIIPALRGQRQSHSAARSHRIAVKPPTDPPAAAWDSSALFRQRFDEFRSPALSETRRRTLGRQAKTRIAKKWLAPLVLAPAQKRVGHSQKELVAHVDSAKATPFR